MSESGDSVESETVTERTDVGEQAQAGPHLDVRHSERSGRSVIFDLQDVSVLYASFRAVLDVSLPIRENEITALIGPSGCGKTTVIRCLTRAALWDEVKDKLKESGMALSGGQQQRLCIARAIATRPDVILMDEPCSALDPIATLRIEELMQELVADYTIVIVTHNMQQAARVSDRTAFFTVDVREDGQRTGTLVEFDRTEVMFTNPSEKRTEDYVTGRFG